MMADEHVDPCIVLQPEIAAYALGERPLDENLRMHLESCPTCQTTLRSYAHVARALPYTAPDAAPSPSLRQRILAAVEPEVPSAPQSMHTARPQRHWWQRRITFAWGVAVAAMLSLLVWNIALQRQLDQRNSQIAMSRENWQTMTRLLNRPDIQSFALTGEQATATFWASPQDTVGCLVAQGLPSPGEGRVYQVWLMRDGVPVSLGTFIPYQGNAWTLVRTDQSPITFEAIGVTIEPSGGSTVPTGATVLQAQLTPSALIPHDGSFTVAMVPGLFQHPIDPLRNEFLQFLPF